jgi:hypothetical protein
VAVPARQDEAIMTCNHRHMATAELVAKLDRAGVEMRRPEVHEQCRCGEWLVFRYETIIGGTVTPGLTFPYRAVAVLPSNFLGFICGSTDSWPVQDCK